MRFYETLVDMFDRIEIEPDRFIESGDLVVVPNSARFRGRDGIETFAQLNACSKESGRWISFLLLLCRVAEYAIFLATIELKFL